MEETNSRLDELTNQIRELEKARKQASAEIERKEQEIKNQKSQLKETENQLKREQETCERLKKIKQERDSGMTHLPYDSFYMTHMICALSIFSPRVVYSAQKSDEFHFRK